MTDHDAMQAALEHDAVVRTVLVFEDGLPLRQAEKLGYAGGEFVVFVPVRVFGPGVEAPVGEGDFACGIADEDGAGVAGPDAVSGPEMEGYLVEVGVSALENGGCAELGFFVVDGDVDVLAGGEEADDFSVKPWDGLEFAGPVFRVVGPGEPGGGVGFPLGGHAVAELLGCFGVCGQSGHFYIESPSAGQGVTGSRNRWVMPE